MDGNCLGRAGAALLVLTLATLPAAGQQGEMAANIVARVDEKVVLLQDAMAPFKKVLERARKELSPTEYAKLERKLVMERTQVLIDRAVLLKELQTRFGQKGVVDNVKKAIRGEFEKNLVKVAREQGLKGRDEVIAALERDGTSLEDQRREFTDNSLAQILLDQLVRNQISEPTREEMLHYYRENLDQFRENAGAVWRHIEVKIGAKPKEAAEKIHTADNRLRAGEDFATVARELSDEATAPQGGLYPLTSKGSYFEPTVDKALFSQPIGEVSTIIRGRDSFHIVKVESRTDGGPKPFNLVQTEIKKGMQDKKLNGLRKAKVAELRKGHYIETVFDSEADISAREQNAASR